MSPAGQFKYPYSVAVDGSGNVYVADTENHRIQKFGPDGTFLTQWGSLGSGDGEFNRPYGVAVEGGFVYVADTNNHRIQKFMRVVLTHLSLMVKNYRGSKVEELAFSYADGGVRERPTPPNR